MYPGAWTSTQPDKPALISWNSGARLTYAELEERSLRLANHFRAIGLHPGDHIAVLAENCFEIVETYWAAQRSGLTIIAVNWHLTARESAYIITDSDARLLVVSGRLENAAEVIAACPDLEFTLSFGAPLDGTTGYEEAMAGASPVRPAYEPRGNDMLYSSGTTGRPKGVLPPPRDQPVEDGSIGDVRLFEAMYGFDSDTVYLSPAPLYHAAPLRFVGVTVSLGGTAVIMDRFDAEQALDAIQTHRVTHSQWVPTMFIRLLRLPDEVRAAYDTSSLRVAIQAAAPCPVDVKQAMIRWWGSIIEEFYSSTESAGHTFISSAQALERPGSVGREAGPSTIHIVGADGQELPAGEVGAIYFEKDEPHFEYYKDPEKTAASRHPEHPTWATTGDIGYLDEDRYLYLTDRTDFMIISGGVNIYPQEIENLLALHPAVSDVAVAGVPSPDLGEEVVAFIEPTAGTATDDTTVAEVLAWLAPRLARYKIPRQVRFVDRLPRTPTGKLVKGDLPVATGAPQ